MEVPSIPHLVFDEDWIPPNDLEVEDIVNGVLLVHEGPVHKFVFSDHYMSSHHHPMDQWMLFLSKHGIKQLTLGTFLDGDIYKMHSSLFSCQELTDLELFSYEIKPPPAFEGFSGLRNLKLIDIFIAIDELEWLISMCPLLETLTLENIHGMIRFKINAPNLRYLCFDIEMESSAYDAEHLKQGGVCNLIEVLGSLHHIEELRMHCLSLQFLSMGYIPDVLPTSFVRLKNLSVSISFMDSKEVFTTLCMLRSYPNSEKLELHIIDRKGEPCSTPLEVFWEAQEHLGCLLNHLQTVKMTKIMGKQCELCFIRFLLANAPLLETMSIGISEGIKKVRKLRFLQDMLQLQRASVQVIIRCDWEST